MHYNFEMSRGNSSIFGISRVKLSNINHFFFLSVNVARVNVFLGFPLARCVPPDHGRRPANQLSWCTQGRGQVGTLTRSVHSSWV